MTLSNKTLLRQLKRTLGVANGDELLQLLAAAEPDAAQLARRNAILAKLPDLLAQVAESYEQYDRNAALQARSMELSSGELQTANERLRAEASAQQIVLDALHETTAELLGSKQPEHKPLNDVVALTQLVRSLVAERERALAALSENDRKLRSLIENVPGCVYRIKPSEVLQFDFVSDGILALSGYSASEVTADPVAMHIRMVGEDMARLKAERIAAAVGHHQPYELEYEMRHRDGSSCWILERGQGAYDEHGQLL
uniref:PAS domain-containing protein n=1 Tax=Chitinimonas sp. TaxID=1934313 RepID=UPI0035B34421